MAVPTPGITEPIAAPNNAPPAASAVLDAALLAISAMRLLVFCAFFA